MIFPLGDDNRDRKGWPLVNIGLIAANIFVFVVFQGMGTNEKFTMAFSTVPAEIVSGRDLVTNDRVVEIPSATGRAERVTVPGLQPTPIPVYFTLLTAIFMHGGLMHLAGNMWFLWIFGDNIEDDLGRIRYFVFYILTGLVASLAHVFLNTTGDASQIPSLGASGAISGVMGAYLLLHPHRQVTVLMLRVIMQVPGYVAVGLWFLFQLISGLGLLGGMETGGVAYAAHIGGFIAGAILAKPFMIGRPAPSPIGSPAYRGPSGW
jgi:membrane associated rhomboid family serine protease